MEISIVTNLWLLAVCKGKTQNHCYIKSTSSVYTQVEYVYLLPMHYKSPLQTMDKKNPKTSSSPWGCGTPCNKPTPGPTQVTTPNGSSIASCIFTQLCSKVPTGYKGCPTFTPKIAPSRKAMSIPCTCLILGPSWPTIPNGIQIQSVIFHNTLGRQTNGWSDRQMG